VFVHFASNTVLFGSRYCIMHQHDGPVLVEGVQEEPPQKVAHVKEDRLEQQIRPQGPFQRNIVMINGAWFFGMVKRGQLTIFKASLNDINHAVEAKDLMEWPLEEIVPQQYHQFLPQFNTFLADTLSPH